MRVGIVGHCWVMVGLVGHFVVEAEVVECWAEEEEGFEEEEEEVVSYLVMRVGEFVGAGG